MELSTDSQTVITRNIPIASVAFVHVPTRSTLLGKLDYDTSYGDETVMHNNQRWNSLRAHEHFTIEMMHSVLGVLKQA